MKTLWAGIPRNDVLCYSPRASMLVGAMEHADSIVTIVGSLAVRALFDPNNVCIGIGMIIAQTSQESMTFDDEKHKQYLWLAEKELRLHGIGPANLIELRVNDVRKESNIPEDWG